MRNLAYYRVGGQHPIGWKDPPLVATASFWRLVNGNFIDACVLDWCKLLGDAKGQHFWRRIVSDDKFKAELLRHLNVSDAEFEEFRLKMREYRDKFVAHLDSNLVMNIPTLGVARKSVEYHAYVASNEAQAGDLTGWPDTADKLKGGYTEATNEAETVYERIFPRGGR
jgi:hypothetical protein